MRTSNILYRMLVLLLMVAGSGLGVTVAQNNNPAIRPLAFDDNAVMNRMSDNGKWAVFAAVNSGNSTLR